MADNYVYTEEKRELVKEGAYECFIEKAVINETQSGKSKIDLTIRVRNDVEQDFKNRVIYDTIWKDKENDELYDRRKINKILGTQKVKEGTSFADIDAVLNVIRGASLIANVGVRFSEYRGKDENYIKWYNTTQVAAQTFNKAPITNETIEITEEELPF